MAFDETDPEGKARLSAFTQGLSELGWTDSRNLRMDVRWAIDNVDRVRALAKELVDLQPDVILGAATPSTAALQRATRTIPIVFASVSDPVGSGFVAGLPRPGGNITGFSDIEASMGGKWLQLITEIAPGVKRVAAMFNPDTAPYVRSYYLPSFEAATQSRKVEPIAAPVHSDAEIGTVMTSLGGKPPHRRLYCGERRHLQCPVPLRRLLTRFPQSSPRPIPRPAPLCSVMRSRPSRSAVLRAVKSIWRTWSGRSSTPSVGRSRSANST
jgi:hypothetical protein